MIAALGTLPFLATIWLVVVLGASLLEESGEKIAAALGGASATLSNKAIAPARLRRVADGRLWEVRARLRRRVGGIREGVVVFAGKGHGQATRESPAGSAAQESHARRRC